MPSSDVHAPLQGPVVLSDEFLADVLAGLTAYPKRIPPKHFYDARGSRLFERICELEEYYPTRTELAIMLAHVTELAARLGPQCLLIEPGSGSGKKTQLLLSHLEDPAGYVPVDIAREQLVESSRALRGIFPALLIRPIHADFSGVFEIPDIPSNRRVVFFPGSTIGNLTPDEAVILLRRFAAVTGEGGGLLIGIDLAKDVSVLEAAYNDRAGVTAAFNLNLLHRIRRELGAELRVDQFQHRAFYNGSEGRIEMHLVSLVAQTIRLDDTELHFEAGETIHTESSYKYGPESFEALAAEAGWRRRARWTDDDRYFGIEYCER
ncbi:MAG: L-histidine N(alpha)-methyltransferase [Planctomycetota bacterium]|jgi:dimethylhistidine N-methyltransferase